jgi:hypothetical protein
MTDTGVVEARKIVERDVSGSLSGNVEGQDNRTPVCCCCCLLWSFVVVFVAVVVVVVVVVVVLVVDADPQLGPCVSRLGLFASVSESMETFR